MFCFKPVDLCWTAHCQLLIHVIWFSGRKAFIHCQIRQKLQRASLKSPKWMIESLLAVCLFWPLTSIPVRTCLRTSVNRWPWAWSPSSTTPRGCSCSAASAASSSPWPPRSWGRSLPPSGSSARPPSSTWRASAASWTSSWIPKRPSRPGRGRHASSASSCEEDEEDEEGGLGRGGMNWWTWTCDRV